MNQVHRVDIIYKPDNEHLKMERVFCPPGRLLPMNELRAFLSQPLNQDVEHEQPCNTAMQIDTKPCLVQAHSVYKLNGAKFCQDCGEALSK